MEEGNGKGNYRDEFYSVPVRAGKRTYFFDVKATRGGDLYLTITESKKRFHADGNFYFEKHKLFLYKEDFEKFSDGFTDVINKIEELKDSQDFSSERPEPQEKAPVEESTPNEAEDNSTDQPEDDTEGNEFKEVDFDDLGK